MTPGSLDPHGTALARSRTYGLLAEILLDGWTDRVLAVIGDLPWAQAIPRDADRRAARHQQVFGRGVPPYESVFCAPDAMLGGPITAEVREAYARMGFSPRRTDVEPDHAGVQCAALSHLCAAEADALEDGVPSDRFSLGQAHFLNAHLARWVQPFCVAVERQGVEELSEVARLLRDLVADHVGGTLPAQPAEVPDAGLLDDPKTGLKAVARFLLVPARCGVWLGLEDIQRIALRAGLACGFGRRIQMMESLWFSAVDHGRVPELVDAMLEAFADPGLQADPRVASTCVLLARIREA